MDGEASIMVGDSNSSVALIQNVVPPAGQLSSRGRIRFAVEGPTETPSKVHRMMVAIKNHFFRLLWKAAHTVPQNSNDQNKLMLSNCKPAKIAPKGTPSPNKSSLLIWVNTTVPIEASISSSCNLAVNCRAASFSLSCPFAPESSPPM